MIAIAPISDAGMMTRSDSSTRGLGRCYAAEPDVLIDQLRKGEAITEADTLLLGVAYNAHVIEAILTHVAPALGWR
jgi:hypothetical protein